MELPSEANTMDARSYCGFSRVSKLGRLSFDSEMKKKITAAIPIKDKPQRPMIIFLKIFLSFPFPGPVIFCIRIAKNKVFKAVYESKFVEKILNNRYIESKL